MGLEFVAGRFKRNIKNCCHQVLSGQDCSYSQKAMLVCCLSDEITHLA